MTAKELSEATMDLGQYWAKDKWWLGEEYSRVWTYRGITQEDVEDRINRVIEVFDPEWQKQCTRPNAALYRLLAQGLVPFQFLFGLGGNLRSVADCFRIKHVIEDLRLPDNFESALLELELAAHLTRDKGHKIEFRPPLDTGKESDFSATYSEQKVFFEIKRMQPSNRQQAMDALGHEVGFVASDVEFNFPHLAGKWFRIELDPYVADLMSGEPAADRPTIRSIVNDIRREIVSRAETHPAFEIPQLAKVTVVTERTESGVNWPMPSSQAELMRFIRAHLQKAITQLPPDYPGVIVAQTPALLDEELTTRIIVGWLKESGATHVSAVVFLPVYNWMPRTWALFKPFSVVNEEAKFPAPDLHAFRDLAPLLTNEVAIPSDE